MMHCLGALERVPEAVVVTGANPGDIFVHRNIAKYVSLSFLACSGVT